MNNASIKFQLAYALIVLTLFFISCKSNEKFKYCTSKLSIEYPATSFQYHNSNSTMDFICDYPQKIIVDNLSFIADTMFDYRIHNTDKKCLVKYRKNNIGIKNKISSLILEKLNVKSDTILEKSYLITYDSIIKNPKHLNNSMLTTMENLTMNLRFLTHSSIVLGKASEEPFYIDSKILKIKDIDELSDFLYLNYNIKLFTNDSIHSVKIIYYMQ